MWLRIDQRIVRADARLLCHRLPLISIVVCSRTIWTCRAHLTRKLMCNMRVARAVLRLRTRGTSCGRAKIVVRERTGHAILSGARRLFHNSSGARPLTIALSWRAPCRLRFPLLAPLLPLPPAIFPWRIALPIRPPPIPLFSNTERILISFPRPVPAMNIVVGVRRCSII